MVKEEFQWTGERLTTAKDNETVTQHLHRYALALDLVRDKVVLDIASGEGYGSNLMATVAQKVVGVDISEDVIKFAQSKYIKPNLQFQVGSADKMPVPDHSIDVLVSFETLEHHDKHEEMLQEIKRVLKPDGVLIMSSPDKMNYSDVPKFSNKFHVKELYREEFKALIEQHFSHVIIYYQSVLYGSLIIPENGIGKNFVKFTGDFNRIDHLPFTNTSVYNLCIASNKNIDGLRSYDFSFFNAEKVLARLLTMEREIYNSKTYKAGRLVSAPLRFFRNIFSKA